MKVIVMGCGRVGSTLAGQFEHEGHEICVIDKNPQARALLERNFTGQFEVGNGYSRAVLERAGVDQADAFIAVTSGDNTNIVGARTAKEVYRVPAVIARIYDPRRAEIYRDLGIVTVASVQWTVGQIRRLLEHRHLTPAQTFGNDETLLVRERLPDYLAGRPLSEFEVDGEIRAVEVTRLGRSFVPGAATRIEPGDIATFAVADRSLRLLRSFLHKDLGA
ncbi:potassium channel family protein [Flindersiella endophytica]